MIGQVSNNATGAANRTASQMNAVDPTEFLKIMIKEMQQQDPFQPVSSKDLINQVGQIRDIQTNLELSKTLKDLALSQKLTSAGVLLGKHVTGKNDQGDDVAGRVTAVRREGDRVYLELDDGQRLSVDHVLTIDDPAGSAGAAGPSDNTNT